MIPIIDFANANRNQIGLERLKIQLNLHIFGNSHAHSFTGSPLHEFGRGSNKEKPWFSYSLGPLSSLDLVKSKKRILEGFLQKYEIKPGASVIFPFGEAECRWYIPRDFNLAHEANESVEIEDILNTYLISAQNIILEFSKRGFDVIVWGGHPSTSGELKDKLRDQKNIPIITSYQDRLYLGIKWHKEMKEFAYSNKLKFVSIFPIMVDKNEKSVEYFLADDCHIKSGILEGFLLSNLMKIGSQNEL
jgi:hypothetical protein